MFLSNNASESFHSYSCIQLPVSPTLTMKATVRNANLQSVCRAGRELFSRSAPLLRLCCNFYACIRTLGMCRLWIPIGHCLFPRQCAVPRIFLCTMTVCTCAWHYNYLNMYTFTQLSLRAIIINRVSHAVCIYHMENLAIMKACIYQWTTSTCTTLLFNALLHLRNSQTVISYHPVCRDL